MAEDFAIISTKIAAKSGFLGLGVWVMLLHSYDAAWTRPQLRGLSGWLPKRRYITATWLPELAIWVTLH